MNERARMVAAPRIRLPSASSCVRTMVWLVAWVGENVGTDSA